MSTQLDHLVYATPDLAATTEAITMQLGVAPVVGGSHVGRGTANTLLALGEGAYLEIVGPDPAQPHPASPRPFGVDDLTAARLVTFAIRVPSMETALADARAGGYDPGEAEAMKRATPDGTVLSWTLTRPTISGPSAGIVPFLVDWLDSPHPSQTIGAAVRLREFIVASPDRRRVGETFAALGLAIGVERADAPLLTAVIEGPTGSVTLSGAVPAPRRATSGDPGREDRS